MQGTQEKSDTGYKALSNVGFVSASVVAVLFAGSAVGAWSTGAPTWAAVGLVGLALTMVPVVVIIGLLTSILERTDSEPSS